jgi:hypothetical protein
MSRGIAEVCQALDYSLTGRISVIGHRGQRSETRRGCGTLPFFTDLQKDERPCLRIFAASLAVKKMGKAFIGKSAS